MSKRFLRICVEVSAGSSEAVSALLIEAGAAGTEIQDATTDPRLGDTSRVVAWFSPGPGVAERVAQYVLEGTAAAGWDGVEVETSEEVDPGWADAWRESFTAVRVGKRIVVRPPWRELAEPRRGDVVVIIEPGMAFGTGGHATTRLCLAAIERSVKQAPVHTVLDVGTGSGVLAIAAIKLGAQRAVGIDVDPIALEAARDNARRNGVSEHIEVQQPWPEEVFDLVVANLTTPTLRSLTEQLAVALRPTGRLIVSGVLAEEADGLAEAMGRHGLKEDRREGLSEDAHWVALEWVP